MTFKTQSRSQLQRHIRTTARDSSRVFISKHAAVRMRQRKVLDAEVYHCLQHGSILQEPEEDIKTGHLVCRMECYGASRNLAVCVALDDNDPSMIVVTVLV